MTRSPIWHPFTQHGLEEPIPVIARAQGASLYTGEGRRIIDGISSWWVTTHGHCYPRIMKAIAGQAEKLDQMIFAGWSHEPAENFVRELIDFLPIDLPYLFFSDSGSTCVEVAIKMALGYWASRGEEKHRILVMEHSYHGDTIGAMSVGERGVFNATYAPLLFDVGKIPFPSAGNEQATLDALELACRNENPAAFIVEPLVLGAGGMLVYEASTLAAMHEICAWHGVLFIADEVMTGWGRTGTLLACEQAEITPDLLCLAKGITGGAIPLAATLASAAIYDAHWSTDRSRMFYHSSSYTANPLACTAALANLEVWREEPVRDRIATLCQRQSSGLAKIAKLPGITNPRQAGTIIAFDYEVKSGSGYLSELAPKLRDFFLDSNVLLRPLGNTAYAMPPYCIDGADLEKVHGVMRDATDLV